MSGPATDATPNVAPSKPANIGRFLGSTEKAMMVYMPEVTPAAAIPAIALPQIKAVLLGATAQIKLPTSKIAALSKNAVLIGKNLKAFPQDARKHAYVSRNAAPYQPTSSRE
jgi:hypothetical protein